MEYTTVKPRQLPGILKGAWKAGLVPHIQSSPGVGKSAIVEQTAMAEGLPMWTWVLAHAMVEDFRFPFPRDGKVEWLYPSTFPDRDGVLFIDEVKQASTAVQNVLAQLIYNRRVDNYRLPDGVRLVLASNLDSDKAGTNMMPTHVRNRLLHLYLQVDAEDWLEWASAAGMPPILRAFIAYRPSALYAKEGWQSMYAFPTPRSWEKVGRAMEVFEGAELRPVVEGLVGYEAVEFLRFMKLHTKLPDIDGILAGKDVPVPESREAIFLTAMILADRITTANSKAALAWTRKLGLDVAVMVAKQIKARLKGVMGQQSEYTLANKLAQIPGLKDILLEVKDALAQA